MQTFSTFAWIALSAALFLNGCKGKAGDPGPAGAVGANGPQGPIGQNLTGNMLGYVITFDEAGNSTARDGVTVSLIGSSPLMSAISDPSGRFQIPSVGAGTYNLLYERPGYGTLRHFGVAHVGGTQATYLGQTQMVETVKSTIASLSVSPTPGTTSTYTVLMSNVSVAGGRVSVYIGNSPNVSSSGYLVKLGPSSIQRPATVVNGLIYNGQLTLLGLPRGSTAYAIAATEPAYISSYFDVNTGQTVIANAGVSTAPVAFIVQ